MLHIYSQQFWHNDVYVVGSLKDISKLSKSLQRMIELGSNSLVTNTFFPSDGEGFKIQIKVVEDSVIEKLPLPYSDEVASDNDEEAWKRLKELFSES